jgi:hypothetical protein
MLVMTPIFIQVGTTVYVGGGLHLAQFAIDWATRIGKEYTVLPFGVQFSFSSVDMASQAYDLLRSMA